MGTIYEALDKRLSCIVALKQTLAFTDESRKAFEREAALLANLRHPALPKVMDYFSEGDHDFLVMEFIPGNDLAEWLEMNEKGFPVKEVLGWAEELLKVLEYLHGRQPPILHRDIKPSNLKLTKQRELFLLDFGLAKGAAGQMPTLVASRSVSGYTPLYAPLEQIHGQGTDPRSDLYSLGATLYHLLTGVPPVAAPTRFTAIEDEEPDPLRPINQLNPEVPAAVAAVIHQAMALSRKQRPGSATEMYRALRQAMEEESRAAALKEEERLRAEEAARAANDRQQQENEAQRLAAEALRRQEERRESGPEQVERRAGAERKVRAAEAPAGQRERKQPRRPAKEQGAEPFSKTILAGVRRILSVTALTLMPLILGVAADAFKRGSLLAALQYDWPILALGAAVGLIGGITLIFHGSEKLKLANALIAGALLGVFYSIALTFVENPHRQGRDLIIGGAVVGLVGWVIGKVFGWWGRRSPRFSRIIQGASPSVTTRNSSAQTISNSRPVGWKLWLIYALVLPLIPASIYLAPSFYEWWMQVTVLRVHDLAPGNYHVAYTMSADGKTLASGTGGYGPQCCSIFLWDVEAGKVKLELKGHTDSVGTIAFSPDGRMLASGGSDKKIKLWDARTGEVKRSLDTEDYIYSIAFSSDGKQLATGLGKEVASAGLGQALVWDVESGKLTREIKGVTRWINSVAFSRDGKRLAVGEEFGQVMVWDLAAGKLKQNLKGLTEPITDLAFSPDGKSLAGGANGKVAALWDVETGELKHKLQNIGEVRSVAFSPDGKALACGNAANIDGVGIMLWDAQTGEIKRTFKESKGVSYLAFSPDGNTLVSASGDEIVKLWKLPG